MSKARRLVLVDLENLVCCPPMEASVSLYQAALDELTGAVNLSDDDLVIIGVNPGLAFVAGKVAPSARIVTRSGKDGADLRLIAELEDLSFITRRFDEIVIASGDGIFAEMVKRLSLASVMTVVASVPGHLSWKLRRAAERVVWLFPPAHPSERVA